LLGQSLKIKNQWKLIHKYLLVDFYLFYMFLKMQINIKILNFIFIPILTASKPEPKPRLVAEKSQYYPSPCTAWCWEGDGRRWGVLSLQP
jgi:hypothetical protein